MLVSRSVLSFACMLGCVAGGPSEEPTSEPVRLPVVEREPPPKAEARPLCEHIETLAAAEHGHAADASAIERCMAELDALRDELGARAFSDYAVCVDAASEFGALIRCDAEATVVRETRAACEAVVYLCHKPLPGTLKVGCGTFGSKCDRAAEEATRAAELERCVVALDRLDADARAAELACINDSADSRGLEACQVEC